MKDTNKKRAAITSMYVFRNRCEFAMLTVVVVFGSLVVSCKRDSKKKVSEEQNETSISAVAAAEIKNSGAFYRATVEKEFEVNFGKLDVSGQSENTPYSGSWYPEKSGGTGIISVGSARSALQQYDQAFYGGRSQASLWEQRYHSDRITNWSGHCNGFSAASARHAEPVSSVMRNGVTFDPVHIKALLAEMYMSSNYFPLGGRRCQASSEIGTNPDSRRYAHIMGECEDVNPGTLHLAITNWIGDLKKVLVIDTSRDAAVWNYPAYKYSFTSMVVTPVQALSIIGSRKTRYEFNSKAEELRHVRLTLFYRGAGEVEEVPGRINPVELKLQYILEMNKEGDVVGGEWAAVSRDKHPDFIWVPMEPIQGTGHRRFANPYLDVAAVLGIWAESAGFGELKNAPKQVSAESWVTSWGDFGGFSVAIDGARRGAVFLQNEGNQLVLTRAEGIPKLSLELNGEQITESLNAQIDASADGKIVQVFKINPKPGINWAGFSYTIGNSRISKSSLIHVLQ